MRQKIYVIGGSDISAQVCTHLKAHITDVQTIDEIHEQHKEVFKFEAPRLTFDKPIITIQEPNKRETRRDYNRNKWKR